MSVCGGYLLGRMEGPMSSEQGHSHRLGQRWSDLAFCHPGGVTALLLPHYAPGGPNTLTVPCHQEGQAPSGRWRKS